MATEKRLIYVEDAMKWIIESKVPETGAFTKGINKGLNIALSTLGNNEVLPAADAVEVVRCKNCKNSSKEKNGRCFCGRCFCECFHCYVDEEDFCAYGELK